MISAFSPSSASWINGLLKPSSTRRLRTMRRMVEKSSTTRIFMFLSKPHSPLVLFGRRYRTPGSPVPLVSRFRLTKCSIAPVTQPCAQPDHRLAMDLADARFAHTEHGADFLQVQF